MEKLPLETQTLYAELLEQLTALETRRSIGQASGCFTTKTVKGRTYYYFQYSDPGGKPRQKYVGKKAPVLDKIVSRYEQERAALAGDQESVRRLTALLRAGGASVTEAAPSRVLKALAESGVFHAGGVLIGTQAFTILGNLLGVRWKSSSLKTHDIDIAGELRIDLAVPEVPSDLPKALETLAMGFLPVPPLNPKHPSTSFKVRGQPLRVDLLTPGKTGREKAPVFIRRFNAAAQPLPFLDYLIEEYDRGAVVNGGGVLVNVPTPARFAFHKLITAQRRPAAMHTKRDKDLNQTLQLVSVLTEERPGDLLLAWDALRSRGPTWVKRAKTGLAILKKLDPEEHGKMATLLKLS